MTNSIIERMLPALRLALLLLLPALAQTGCFQLRAVQEDNARLKQLVGEMEMQNEKYKTDFYTLLEQKKRQEAESDKEARYLEREVEKQKNLRGEREKSLEERNQELTLLLQQQREEQAQSEKKLRDDLENSARALAGKDESLVTTQEKNTALLALIKAKEDELAETNKQLAELDVQLKQAIAQKLEFQKKFDDDQLGADERKTQLANLTRENAALKETIADKDEDIAAKDKKVDELNAEKKLLEAGIDQRKALEDEIQRRIKLLQEDNGADPQALDRQKQEIEELKRNLEKIKSAEALSPAEQDPELNKAETLLRESFRAELNNGVFTLLRDSRGVVIRIPSDQLFDSGTVVLHDTLRPTLKILASALAQFHHHTIDVQGYTDNQPVINMPFPDNLALSSQRAVNIARFLAENGLPAEAVRATACGAAKLLGENNKPAGRKLNRRVEIVLEPLVK